MIKQLIAEHWWQFIILVAIAIYFLAYWPKAAKKQKKENDK